VPPSVRLR